MSSPQLGGPRCSESYRGAPTGPFVPALGEARLRERAAPTVALLLVAEIIHRNLADGRDITSGAYLGEGARRSHVHYSATTSQPHLHQRHTL